MDMGLVYQLGHQGHPCLYPKTGPHTMTVIDLNHVHQVRYLECACSQDLPTRPQQLLRVGWYPATVTDPDTCATVRVLELFRVQNVVGNMNVDSFMKSLERLTDATGQRWVPVSLLSSCVFFHNLNFVRSELVYSCVCPANIICLSGSNELGVHIRQVDSSRLDQESSL